MKRTGRSAEGAQFLDADKKRLGFLNRSRAYGNPPGFPQGERFSKNLPGSDTGYNRPVSPNIIAHQMNRPRNDNAHIGYFIILRKNTGAFPEFPRAGLKTIQKFLNLLNPDTLEKAASKQWKYKFSHFFLRFVVKTTGLTGL
jgi:hypothetical protein